MESVDIRERVRVEDENEEDEDKVEWASDNETNEEEKFQSEVDSET